MEPSKQKKPSLPRLATNLPAESQSSPSLPLQRRRSQELNVKPRPERPITLPSPFPGREENIVPAVRYTPETKGLYMEEDFGDPAIIKKKTQYYRDAFATRSSHNSPQERVTQDSVVVVELKTNYKPKNQQQKLVSDLILRLAEIYQRPESCIMLTIEQDAGVFFGSTSERSYLIKVYALPSFVAPLTNLRNTNLIQVAMVELLDIPISRGVIVYIPVPDENFATNGVTARGEISRLEQRDEEDSPGIIESISRSMSRRLKTSSGNSVPISLPSTVGTATTSPSMKTEIHHSPINLPGLPESPGEEKERGRRLRKRMSLRSIVRRRLNEIKPNREKDEKEKAKESTKSGKEREDDQGKSKQGDTQVKAEEQNPQETKGQ
ncbi:Tautomerase [Penicillium angulare]|uniref:Tautomerase n=1 Tax=Penicillium angulare TaxID=116970 RepID=UPI0025410DC5|nr:Tautomerase [Penicillium angulare]KAJ5259233.1 Tautomerase [Penicillium angulare]